MEGESEDKREDTLKEETGRGGTLETYCDQPIPVKLKERRVRKTKTE